MEQVSGGINPGGSTVGLRFPLGEPVKEVRDYGNIKLIRGLIWIYFFLLIFEGFLRMVLPSMSNALLVVRDPFLLVMYVVALVSRVFPWNKFVAMFWILGFVSVFFGFIQNPGSPLVTLFGFRSSFLHVPMIFLISNVMDKRDVKKFGLWFLILSLPMAILMVAQFQVGPEHWLNRGLDMQFKQITAAAGKIRPPGTFSFVMGPILFFSNVVSFILLSQFEVKQYPRVLVVLATSATCIALAVSGSRSALAGVAVVILVALTTVLLTKPREVTQITKFFFVAGTALLLVSQLSVFDEGTSVLSQRIESASSTEGGFSGFLERTFGEFISGYHAIGVSDLLGAGLGVGTNAGSALQSGKVTYLLAEGEWARQILELGPFLGTMYLSMRLGLLMWLIFRALASAYHRNMAPILVLGACIMTILGGQWGQPTALGFAVVGGGLTLAAMRRPDELVQLGSPA